MADRLNIDKLWQETITIPVDMLEIPISTLNIRPVARFALLNTGLTNLSDLNGIRWGKLLQLPEFGRQSAKSLLIILGGDPSRYHAPPKRRAKPSANIHIGAVNLTFREFVIEIERRHGFSPAKRRTTIGRLQQLQKLGLSKATGRGKKANYSEDDLRAMSAVLDMLDEGASPAFAIRRVRGDTSRGLDCLRQPE